MLTKDINALSIGDFHALVENEVPEGRSIEYKRELKLATDGDKKEFLADVSSFANSSGGDIIYGISERKDSNIPEAAVGIEVPNLDETLRQIEALIRDGVAPRLNGITLKEFSLSAGRMILLIRIEKSWNSPHQVTLKGSDKFYSRGSVGKYPMDLTELRASFLLSENIATKIRNFVTERLSIITSENPPVPLLPCGKAILHLIPSSSFQTGRSLAINQLNSPIRKVRPLFGGSRTPRFNIDGLITSSLSTIGSNYSASYAQVFRNGIIETVSAELLDGFNGEKYLRASGERSYEAQIVETVEEYVELYKSINVDCPIFLFISFTDMIGYKFYHSQVDRPAQGNVAVTKNVIFLPEITINNFENDIPSLLQPVFDIVWNAFGYAASRNYLADGTWSPPRD